MNTFGRQLARMISQQDQLEAHLMNKKQLSPDNLVKFAHRQTRLVHLAREHDDVEIELVASLAVYAVMSLMIKYMEREAEDKPPCMPVPAWLRLKRWLAALFRRNRKER